METTLTILQYKEILEALKSSHNVDLAQHSMASLRYNFAHIMQNSKYNSVPSFIKGIQTDRLFFENVISSIYNEHISLFRDPSMWRALKSEVFDNVLHKSNLKIWIPEVSKGSDYYSLIILLEHFNLLNKASIIISDTSHINLDKCRRGEIDIDVINNSVSNFKRFDANENINNYIQRKANKYVINKELLKSTISLRSGVLDINMLSNPNIILFRNRFIYYNHVKEQRVINRLHQVLKAGGYLVTGIMEDISAFSIDKKFRIHNSKEHIYKRNF